jgi:Tfp pilus assembly protein PilO
MNGLQHMQSQIGYSLRHRAVRAGVVACLLAAIGLAVAAIVWWPAERANAALTERLADERRALIEGKQAGEAARVHARNLQVVPALEAKLDAAVDQTEIVDGLGRLARRHGLRIVNQSYAERRDQGRGAGLVVELAVEGRYGAVRNFLHGIAGLPVWIEVNEVQLDRAGDSGAVKGRLRLTSFRRDGRRGG